MIKKDHEAGTIGTGEASRVVDEEPPAAPEPDPAARLDGDARESDGRPAEAGDAKGVAHPVDGGASALVGLPVGEPLLPARVHRPSDLTRFVVGLVGLGLVLFVAGVATGTANGLDEDIGNSAAHAPHLLVSFAGFFSTVAVLVVPVAFAVERLVKRDGLRVADGVLAAVLADGAGLAIDLWVHKSAPDQIVAALTRPRPGAGATEALQTYLTPVIAYMTAAGLARRPRWQLTLWAVVVLDGLALLVGDAATPLSIIATVVLGWTVGHGTVYAIGAPNVRPTGAELLENLRRLGLHPNSANRAEDDPRQARRYAVELADGRLLDVTVLDREMQAEGFYYRLYRRIRLRALTTQQRRLFSLRDLLEQEALMSYAAAAAGVHTPELLATSELGPDAVLLAYCHVAGRKLSAVGDEEFDDALLDRVWQQVHRLYVRRIAHRRLGDDTVLLADDGEVYLTGLGGGDIAAGELALRMDIAQLLTTLALRVGARRAVESAARVLGTSVLGTALPMLQPVALSRATRGELRRRRAAERAAAEAAHAAAHAAHVAASHANGSAENAGGRPSAAEARTARRRAAAAKVKAETEQPPTAPAPSGDYQLLSEIRAEILRSRPQAPVAPARLERIRPRTLIMVIAVAAGIYALGSQFSEIHLSTLLDADWGWALGAIAGSVLSYLAAALNLMGFVPGRLPVLRTTAVQLAASFVQLATPAAVGGIALNARYLQRRNLPPAIAVTSVGASQVVNFVMHIALLAIFGYFAGTSNESPLAASRTVIAAILVVAVLALVVAAVPVLRRWVVRRLSALFEGMLPRLMDVVQQPLKLASGIGGAVLISLTKIACLDMCIRAFGGDLNFSAVAVVFLAGSAVGSAVPTPGGVGGVESALVFTLAGFGVSKDVAFSAVMLFRLLTFWLPVLPGWLAFAHLQRRGAV